jgi:serine/threonine-protein kinase
VSGEDAVTAANTLGAKGFSTETAYQSSDTVEKDKVIGTDPPAGTGAAKGSKVKLIISTGKEQVRVPDVVGLSEARATSELQNAGFKVSVHYFTAQSCDSESIGNVSTTVPAANATVPKGSTVTISVGQAPSYCPNLSSSSTTSSTSILGR